MTFFNRTVFDVRCYSPLPLQRVDFAPRHAVRLLSLSPYVCNLSRPLFVLFRTSVVMSSRGGVPDRVGVIALPSFFSRVFSGPYPLPLAASANSFQASSCNSSA